MGKVRNPVGTLKLEINGGADGARSNDLPERAERSSRLG